MARRYFIVGNWKMNGTGADLDQVRQIAEGSREHAGVDAALCLPATLIERAARSIPTFSIGGQDVHRSASGAHTGCVSSAMLLDAGATLTIVGHSERRQDQQESDADVRAKAEAALESGLSVILCVGEGLHLREAGTAVASVTAQLKTSLPYVGGRNFDTVKLAVAYEPIWAIGTGKVASREDIAEMHSALRDTLRSVYGQDGAAIRLLYGGSVKAANAEEILAVTDVDGTLVGGASLTAADFLPIVGAAAKRG